MRYKREALILIIASSILLAGCFKTQSNEDVDAKIKNKENLQGETGEKNQQEEPSFNQVDYSMYFDNISGGAVFFNSEKQQYNVYGGELINKQVSPFSTFKIVSTLMGLEQGVIETKESTLGYDNTIYTREEWNKDIEMEEAFKTSCVWYYKKLISSLDKSYVEGVLKDLEYGNEDISVWDDHGHNGFWLTSSLEISLIEQVKVLEKIFEKENNFKKSNIDIVKEVMLVESNNDYSVYGKTGSGIKENAWFVGFIEKGEEKIFFSLMLHDDNITLAGNKAKDIALNIIANYYAE